MNLFNRLVQQAQGVSTQLNPRSSMSYFEESPVLEQVGVSDNPEASPVNSSSIKHEQNPIQYTDTSSVQAEPATRIDHAPETENESPNVFNITEQADSPSKESSAKKVVPLLSPQQETIVDINQDELNKPVLQEHDPVRQKANPIIAFSKTEPKLSKDKVEAIKNINLYLPDSADDNWQSAKPVSIFQPLLQNTPSDNRGSNLTVFVDKDDPVNSVTSTPVEVHVSIGRIEVKAQKETAQPIIKMATAKTKAPMTLAAYLAKREAGKR